jgi:hypothetical protein
MTITPVAAAPLPVQGAPLADRRSRIRGGRREGRGFGRTVVVPPAVSGAVGG